MHIMQNGFSILKKLGSCKSVRDIAHLVPLDHSTMPQVGIKAHSLIKVRQKPATNPNFGITLSTPSFAIENPTIQVR